MLKKNSIFVRLFLSYSFIIIVSFVLFIGVYFYLFHINLYKEFEDIYQHQFTQVEKLLSYQKKFNWSENETAEIISNYLNQPGYHIYIVDETGKQIFGPDLNQDSPLISRLSEILSRVQSEKIFSKGYIENGELRYTIATKLT